MVKEPVEYSVMYNFSYPKCASFGVKLTDNGRVIYFANGRLNKETNECACHFRAMQEKLKDADYDGKDRKCQLFKEGCEILTEDLLKKLSASK